MRGLGKGISREKKGKERMREKEKKDREKNTQIIFSNKYSKQNF